MFINGLNWKKNTSELLEILDREKETGGGSDESEASLFAVQKAIELSKYFPKTMRALFLITDAPNKASGGHTIETLVNRLNEQNIYFTR